jgi:osmotically inducible protein OsmC
MIRRAKAVWRGTGQAGNGYLTSDSGGSPKPRIFIKTRFIPIGPLRKREGHKSTGLIAAAHAGCLPWRSPFNGRAAGYHSDWIERRSPRAGELGFLHQLIGAHTACKRA